VQYPIIIIKGSKIGNAGNRVIAAAKTHINSNEPFIIARIFFIVFILHNQS